MRGVAFSGGKAWTAFWAETTLIDSPKPSEHVPTTKRQLVYELAQRIGGEMGERLRAALERPGFADLKAWDQPLTAEDYAAQLATLERNVRAAFAASGGRLPDQPGSWGLPN